MRVRWGKVVLFAVIVVAILATVGLTTERVAKSITLGLDLRGGFEVLYEAEPLEEGQEITPNTLASAAEALRKRIDVLGAKEPEITVEGTNRIRVQLAGITDQEKAREILGKPAVLEFRAPDGKVLMRGTDLKEGGARQDYDEYGQPVVSVQFKSADKFAEITRNYIGQSVAIYLDDTILSDPVIQTVIPDGKAIITGNFKAEEAKELADLLNAGSLPVKLEQKQSTAVDASLGSVALEQSLKAGVYGTVVIFIFMIGYYRLPGVIASVTLIAYAYLVLLTFSFLM